MPETNARASEQLKALLAAVEAALPHVDALQNAEQKAEHAQTQLAGTLREYQDAIKRLEVARAQLAQFEADLAAKQHLISDERARALQAADRQIAARQAELAALKNNSKEKL